jgi:hypothetical protein
MSALPESITSDMAAAEKDTGLGPRLLLSVCGVYAETAGAGYRLVPVAGSAALAHLRSSTFVRSARADTVARRHLTSRAGAGIGPRHDADRHQPALAPSPPRQGGLDVRSRLINVRCRRSWLRGMPFDIPRTV